jgi:branched-chain amino acid transport system substrate-binding protein
MRIRSKRFASGLILLFVLSLIAAACSSDDSGGEAAETTTTAAAETTTTAAAETTTTAAAEATEAMSTEPVVVCELAYYTGEFAAYGEGLTADVRFPLEEVINLDPPLGRTWELISEDIGTVGEAQAARTCLEQHDAEVLVSQAHGYRTYRDFMLEWLAENDSPLGPTVHGGTIPGNLGGVGSEPLFRAQGLDEALGMTGVLYADDIGAESIVIFATQVEGFQLASDAAEKTAAALGIEVLDRIDVPAEQPSYRAEAERIATLDPDVVLVQAGSVESATLIKQADEAGLSLDWIGETGWVLPEFIGTLGTGPLESQKSIGFAAFTYDDTSPAWEFYQPLWDNTEPYGIGASYADPDSATGSYHYSTYDLLVQTALAVEYAGSYKASEFAPAMFEVGDPPGTVCYTYQDCVDLIRAGEDIDYEGITGPGTYSAGGVNAITQAYTPFEADGSVGAVIIIDPDRALEVINLIAIEAECDAPNPAGTDPASSACDW